MRVALLQITSSDDPAENLNVVKRMMTQAAADGAQFVLTPEVTNCLSASRDRQREVLSTQATDPTLAGLRDHAASLGLWLNIGSLALKPEGEGGRFHNRSFLIDPAGEIAATYDKIHMFDVALEGEKPIRESDGYQPGDRAVLAETPLGRVGMTICYDLRFPALFRRLAKAGAQILTIPSAFHPVTGAAHWEPLLRARAIENGAFVLAAAQCGTHKASVGRQRESYGHSLVVSPWGQVLADGGSEPGIVSVDLDMDEVEQSRRRVPSLTHDREFKGP